VVSKYQNMGSISSNFGSSNTEVPSPNAEGGCKKCVLLSEHLRGFGKDIGIEFGKELGKEYGKETASKKHMKTMKKLRYERKKMQE